MMLSKCKNSRYNNMRDGFSLVEIIIAIAISSIVMSALILIISFASNNVNRTAARVKLQNQTKDIITHVTTYLQEGHDAHWYPDERVLSIVKTERNAGGVVTGYTMCYYRLIDNTVYFYKDSKKTVDVDSGDVFNYNDIVSGEDLTRFIANPDNQLLRDVKVTGFECKGDDGMNGSGETKISGKKFSVSVETENDKGEHFAENKNVFMRDQV